MGNMRIFQHGVVDSTNERALAAVASGEARDGDVHVAEGQSAGRGRLGRSWSSPNGEGLYLSLVLLPRAAPNPAALTMAAGLGVLEGVRALGASTTRLKWPNDVLAPDERGTDAKLAGILVETRGLDPLPTHAVVGVGLNVLQRAFPAELERERAVTSLALLGLATTRAAALEGLLAALWPRLAQACAAPAEIAADYANASGLLGRAVRVCDARGEHAGRLMALALNGLELELTTGIRTRVQLEHVQSVEALD